jgi:hypothetical protein
MDPLLVVLESASTRIPFGLAVLETENKYSSKTKKDYIYE